MHIYLFSNPKNELQEKYNLVLDYKMSKSFKMHFKAVRSTFLFFNINKQYLIRRPNNKKKECLIVINYTCYCNLHVQLTKTSCDYRV